MSRINIIKIDFDNLTHRIYPEAEEAFWHGAKHYEENPEDNIKSLIDNHWEYRAKMLAVHMVDFDEITITEGLYRMFFLRGWIHARGLVQHEESTGNPTRYEDIDFAVGKESQGKVCLREIQRSLREVEKSLASSCKKDDTNART